MRVTHRRIERGDQSTRRLLHLDTVRAAHVLIRLAIRHEYELAVVQIVYKVQHGRVDGGNCYALSIRYPFSCNLAHLSTRIPSDARLSTRDSPFGHSRADTN